MNLLLLYAAFAVGVSFICSLLEAALLSVPRGHVELMRNSRPREARMLADMKRDIDRPLAGILTLNTVANTAGAAGVGAQAAVVFGEAWLAAVGAVMTLLILIVSEIIPKTLGAVHCRGLAVFTVWAVRTITIVTWPALIMVERLHRFLKPARPMGVSRAEIGAGLRLGYREGALADDEFRVLDNILALRDVRVKDIMTPRTVVFSLPETAATGDACALGPELRFSRIPLCEDSLDDASGYVTRADILHAARRGEADIPLRDLAKKLQPVPDLGSAADALDICLREGEHILLVVDEYGGAAGIITLEDIVETLLGAEIVDETDPVTDMRTLALRHREQRMREGVDGDRASPGEEPDPPPVTEDESPER